MRLANAKLQADPGSAALKLMDCIFSTKEMVNGNPSGVTRSKDEARQRTIQALDPQRMRFIDGMMNTWDISLRVVYTQLFFCSFYSYSPREMGSLYCR